MTQVLTAYNGLLVPAVVGLVLVIVVLKVVNALVKLLCLLLLAAVIVGGVQVYGRLSGIQQAVDATVAQGKSGLTTAVALQNAVAAPAQQALRAAGLNPALLRVHIVCAGPNTKIQLLYADPHALFGALDQYYDVPHSSNVQC